MDAQLVTIAILVSRVEALVLASVLEAEGIPVHVSGSLHASVNPISIALGGHRLMIPPAHHELASLILREVGAENWEFSRGLQRAVLKFAGLWIAVQGAFYGLALAAGAFPPIALINLPLSALSIPVNPQGRGDFYLWQKDH